jgi:hypothetical protein
MRIALVVSLLAACTESGSSPGRFTLTGEVGSSQGLILATSEVIAVDDQLGDADVYLSVRMVFQLRGPGDGPFCDGAIGDHATCAWTQVVLGGNVPQQGDVAGDAYLVRDRFDDALYRMVLADFVVDESNVGTVVFDLESIANAPAR